MSCPGVVVALLLVGTASASVRVVKRTATGAQGGTNGSAAVPDTTEANPSLTEVAQVAAVLAERGMLMRGL